MSRKTIYYFLAIVLILAPLFVSVSCQKLKVNKLKANYHFNRANHLFTDNRYRQAIEEYEKALSFNPDLVEAYRFLGECYKSLYRPSDDSQKNKEIAQKALDALKKAYEANPNNKEVIYSLGDMYDKLRDFKQAEKLYLKIIKMEPTNMSNYYVVAEFYKRYAGSSQKKEGETKAEGGKTPFQKAEEMYLRRIETDPENPQGYAYIAQFYEGITPRPEFDKANYFHERRIKLDPNNPAAWLSKGVNRWSKAYRLPNLPKEERLALAKDSLQALEKANKLDPQYPEPYSWLSVLYKSVLAKLEPQRAQRYNSLADIYAQKFQELRKRQLEREKLEKELKSQQIK
ncbi:MAG: tetratricopeptide repeat protein [Candidatus Aminicenantales bacterium]